MKSHSTIRPRRQYSQVARAASAEATAKRTTEAFLALLMSEWFDDITLDRVAEHAGVAVPTIVRRFGGKEGLLAAAVRLLSAQIVDQRGSPAGDLVAAIDALISDYERTGDAITRLLALAPRYPAVEQVTAFGRKQHRAWLSKAFAQRLLAHGATLRRQVLDALVVATDVYTWKLLRRDLRRSPKQTRATMLRLIAAGLRGPDSSGSALKPPIGRLP